MITHLNEFPAFRVFFFNFRLDPTRIGEILQGTTPSRNGGELSVSEPPKGFPVPEAPD
jgi:Mn-containing catalase